MKLRNFVLAACAAMFTAPAAMAVVPHGPIDSPDLQWVFPFPLQCDRNSTGNTFVKLAVKGNVNIDSVVIRLNGWDVTELLYNSRNKRIEGTLKPRHGLIVVCSDCHNKRRVNVLQATGVDWVTGDTYVNTRFFYQNKYGNGCTSNGSSEFVSVDPHDAINAVENMWLGATNVAQYVANAKIEAKSANTNNSIDETSSVDSSWFIAPINGFGVNVAVLS